MAGAPPEIPEPVTSSLAWLKDVWVPTLTALITAGLAYLGVLITTRQSAKKDKEEYDERLEQVSEKGRLDRIQADTAHSDSLTRRFQSLMDGYENRIKDLTDELTTLRAEVRDLRAALAGQIRETRSLRADLKGALPADNEG